MQSNCKVSSNILRHERPPTGACVQTPPSFLIRKSDRKWAVSEREWKLRVGLARTHWGLARIARGLSACTSRFSIRALRINIWRERKERLVYSLNVYRRRKEKEICSTWCCESHTSEEKGENHECQARAKLGWELLRVQTLSLSRLAWNSRRLSSTLVEFESANVYVCCD